MEVRYEIETGWPSQLSLHKRISAFTREDRCSAFKIGITNNPDRRDSVYRSNGASYHEMVVLYKTDSDGHVRAMEKILTDYYEGRSDNVNAGGGGQKGEGPFYLYITIEKA